MRRPLHAFAAMRAPAPMTSGADAGDGALPATRSAGVSMHAFDLNASTLTFGPMRVDDQVRVRSDLPLTS